MVPQLVRLCLPLLCANVLQQLYNVINSLVVARYLGSGAFAALGVAESVMNLFIYVITGACMGAGVLVAQFYGEGNLPRLRQQLYVSALLIGGCTLTAVVLGQIFLRPLLGLIQTPAELMDDAARYLRIVLVGMLFTFTYNYLAATLRAVGDTKAALYFLLLSLGYNLAAAWLLVAVLGWGVTGTAVATASAQLLSSLLCVWYIRTRRAFLAVGRGDLCFDRTLAGRTGSYAAVAALQQSSLYLGKLMIQGAVNGIDPVGAAPISAFAAATRIENFVQAFGISGCETIAIFAAQNHGAGQKNRAMGGFLAGMAMTVGVGVVFALVLRQGGTALAGLFLEHGSRALELAGGYLRTIGGFYLLSFFGHSFVGWYRGEGRMNVTFLCTTVQVGCRVLGTYLLVPALGLNAVAWATGLGWVVMLAVQLGIFFREKTAG